MFINYKKGEIGHLKVEMRALEKDFIVCYPRIESRFDMVLVDPQGKCFRTQVKYTQREAKESDNAVVVDLRKSTRGCGKVKKYSKNEIDVILIYVHKIDKILWIIPDIFDGKSSLTFRLAPSKNNQIQGIRNASDFIW